MVNNYSNTNRKNHDAFIRLPILIVLTVSFILLTIHLINTEQEQKQTGKIIFTQNNNEKKEENDSEPFKELTIPYLRQRDYRSSLGELSQINSNSSYTTYLTSYDSDDLKINGLITIPNQQQPIEGWPAIVFIHGYIPPAQYETTDKYTEYVDYLAKNGFVVFKIDLRGHGESEGNPGGAYYSGDYVIDTLNAYNALQTADFIDPNKIGLWGHSMGGNVVFRSFIAHQNIPAIVIWSGAVYTYEDFQEYRIQDNSYQPPPETSKRRDELRDTHGEFDPQSEFWKKVVPTNYIEGITGGVQLNHALNDNVVDIRYSRNLHEILKSTDITSQLNEYSSGGHNITGAAFTEAMENTVSFFKQYLGN